VRIVVPGPPGGPAGAISLLLANKLGPQIGQTVIVDNRPGAGGNIAIEHVARSPADGTTLFFGVPALITNPYFQKHSLDPSVLAPVIQLNSGAFLLLVRADSNMKSVADVVARIHAAPGAVGCNAGAVALSTVSCHLLQAHAGPMLMVAYPGNAQALAALERGEIPLAFDFTSSSGGAVREGRLRALAITSKERNTGDFKDVPPIGETIPGFELVGWQGIMVAKDTPPETVTKLNEAFNRVLADPEVIAFMRRGNLELVGGTPQTFGERIRRDFEFYGRVAKAANIEPQ
jgi:tripartite-type tricarboxylate transporter receptor subunit TctC